MKLEGMYQYWQCIGDMVVNWGEEDTVNHNREIFTALKIGEFVYFLILI
jgi:hypothetical protein